MPQIYLQNFRDRTLEADLPIGTMLDTVCPPEGFHRDLVLSMQNGVVAIRRDGSVAVINDCAYRTLGLTPDSRHLGRHFTDVLAARGASDRR